MILFLPFRFRVVNLNDETDVELTVLSIIKIHYDYEIFISKFYKNKDNEVSLDVIYNNISKFLKSRRLIRKLAREIVIKKVIISSNINVPDSNFSPYVYISNWYALDRIRHTLVSYFKRIDNEYYGVVESYNSLNLDVDFDVLISFNLFSLFSGLIKKIS